MRKEVSVPIKEAVLVPIKGYEASDERMGWWAMVAGESLNSPELTYCYVDKDEQEDEN